MPLYKDGNIPFVIRGDDRKDTFLTKEGLVQYTKVTDSLGRSRIKKEILFVANDFIDKAGSPTITSVDFHPKVNANNIVTSIDVEVSFNQEIESKSPITINVQNKTANITQVATSNNHVSNFGNTLNFTFKPSAPGEFFVPPQSILAEGKVYSKLTGKSVANSITNFVLKGADLNYENIPNIGPYVPPEGPGEEPGGEEPPKEILLKSLNLTNNSYRINSEPGTYIGDIVGKANGSVITVTKVGNRISLEDNALLVGNTPTDDAGKINISLREYLEGVPNSPKVTTLSLDVIDGVITLQALTTILKQARAGKVFSTTIRGKTYGSTLSLSGPGSAGLVISGNTISGTPTSSGDINIIERLEIAENSPRTTNGVINVLAEIILQILTSTSDTARAGKSFTATIRRKANNSVLSLSGPGSAGLTITGNLVSGTPTVAGAINITETLDEASNSPRTTDNIVNVLEEIILQPLIVSINSGRVKKPFTSVITGRTEGSTLSLSGPGSAGLNITNNVIFGMPSGAGNVNIIETLNDASNNPRTTSNLINVLPEIVLQPLTVSITHAYTGFPISATISGKTTGSTLSLSGSGIAGLSIVNGQILGTPTTAGAIDIIETLEDASNSPRTTSAVVNIIEAPVLRTLSVAYNSGMVGVPFTSTISGKTSGSTITLSGSGASGLTISDDVISGTPTSVGSINLTETLSYASNSPRTTSNLITVVAAPVLQPLTVIYNSGMVGVAYSSLINGKTDGSTITLTGPGSAGLSVSGNIISGTPTNVGAINLVETLIYATNSPRTTSNLVNIIAAPVLQALTVSNNSAYTGNVFNSNIVGKTDGSTITLSGPGSAGLSVSGTVISGTPTTAGAVNLTETLSYASNNPRTTSNLITVVLAPVLNALTVSNGAAMVGSSFTATISGKTSGSTITLSGPGSSGLSVSGTTISGTPTNVGTINLIETLAIASNSPRTTSNLINVVAAPVLQALTVSNSNAMVGSLFTATISGKTSGSTITLTGPGSSGLSVSGNSISGTPTATGTINLVETLAGAANTPRTTSNLITVIAAPVLQALSVVYNSGMVGVAYSSAITGKTEGSTITLSGPGSAGLTISGTTISGTPTTAGSINLVETLSYASNSPRITSNAISIAAAPVLQALTVSKDMATVGTLFTATISGKTENSVITLSGAGSSGLSVSGNSISGTPTTVGTINLIETLSYASNSPRTTSNAVTVVAATVLNPLSVVYNSGMVGVAYSSTISGKTSGSTITLSGPGSAGLTVSSSTISGTPTTVGAVNLTETLAGASNSPRTTSNVIDIVAAPVLQALTVSNASAMVGVIFNSTISGKTPDSVITLTGPGASGLSVSGTTISGTPTATGRINLVETLSYASNNPRTTNNLIDVVAAPVLQALSVVYNSGMVGVPFDSTISGKTDGSTITLSGAGSSGLSVSGNQITGTPTNAGTINLIETLSYASNSPRTTSNLITVVEAPVLQALTVSTSNATVGRVFSSTISGKTENSTITLSGSGASGLSVSGNSISGTPTTVGTINLIETLSYASNSPRTTSNLISVTAAPVLQPLTVNYNSGMVGVAFNSTISGKTADSTITLSGPGSAGLTISGNTISGTPTTAGAINLVETLSYASNSPRTTSNVISIVEAPVLQALTVNYNSGMVGVSFDSTINNKTDGSTITLTGPGSAGLSVSGNRITGTPTSAGTINLVETLSYASNSPRTTSNIISIVEAPVLQVLTVNYNSGMVGVSLNSTISGKTDGSTITLSGPGASGLSISGNIISGTPTTAGVINLIETLSYASNNPRTTSNVITIVEAPVLQALTVSNASAMVGVSFTSSISGKTDGSTITLSGPGSSGLSVSGATISGIPTNAGTVNLVETLSYASNNPRTTSNLISVAAAPVLQPLSVTYNAGMVGVAYNSAINGKTDGSTITLSGPGAAGLSVTGSTISGTPSTAGAVNLIETLSYASNSPRTTSAAISIAEAPVLQALTVSNASGMVGVSFTSNITGKTDGSTITLAGPGSSGLSVSNSTISGTPTNAGTINLVETLSYASNNPRTTSNLISIAAAPTLQTLTVSNTSAMVGVSFTSTISGKTDGSTITLSGPGASGLSISGTSISGTPTTAGTINLVETLSYATNSPRTTSDVITVAAAPVLNALSVVYNSAMVGVAYNSAINGKTDGSTITLSGPGSAGLSVSGSTISGTPTTAGTVNLVETLSYASNSPRTSSNVISVAAAPVLQSLTVSNSSATVGSAFNSTISGKTDGSTITLSGPGSSGLSVSGTTISGTPTTAGTVNLIETLSYASNNPRTTSNLITVVAAPVLNALTVSNNAATVGTSFTSTISGKTSGSTITLSGAGASGLSVSGTTISGTPTAAGTVNLVETLNTASNSPRTTSNLITVSAASTTPTWVYANAIEDMDFSGNRYWISGKEMTGFSSLLTNAPGTFSRSSVATYRGTGGEMKLTEIAANQPVRGTSRGIYILKSTLNKVTAAKHNPTATTNLSSSNAAMVLRVVNDASFLAEAGLEQVCSNGNVYEADNTAGTAAYFVYFAGTGGLGTTDVHSASIYARQVSGTAGSAQFDQATLLDELESGSFQSNYKQFILDGKVQGGGAQARQFRITVQPGSVVRFILPELILAAYVIPAMPVIGSNTGTMTRAEDMLSLPAKAGTVDEHYMMSDDKLRVERGIILDGNARALTRFNTSRGIKRLTRYPATALPSFTRSFADRPNTLLKDDPLFPTVMTNGGDPSSATIIAEGLLRLNVGSNQPSVMHIARDYGTVDHWVEGTMAAAPGTTTVAGSFSGARLCCRVKDERTYVGLRWTSTAYILERIIRGSTTTLINTNSTRAPAAGDINRIEVRDDTIRWYLNGTLMHEGSLGGLLYDITTAGILNGGSQSSYISNFKHGAFSG